MSKIIKKVLKWICIILSVIIVIICAFFIFVLSGKQKAINLKISTVDLSQISDGIYTGKYNGYRWSNTVEVTVKDHEITDILIIKPQVFMKETAVTEVISRIKSAQSLDVDMVSGATADSKALLKAIENALNSK